MSSSIVIVHSRSAVRQDIAACLASAGYGVDAQAELPPALDARADLVLVEFRSLDPIDARLAPLKRSAGATRVIVLAGQGETADAVRLLEDGVDDCIVVPSEPAELLARVAACLRRPPARIESVPLTAGPIELDRTTHRVCVNDRPVDLAPTEFRLMAFLLENPGRVFSRSELLRRAWGSHIKAGPRTVDVHVRRLRQQLEPFGCDVMLETVRGFGYRLASDARTVRRRGASVRIDASRP